MADNNNVFTAVDQAGYDYYGGGKDYSDCWTYPKEKIDELVGDSLTGIETAKEEAIAAVQEAGSDAVQEIEAKGEETLESIPDDYTQLSEDVSELKADFSAIETFNSDVINQVGFFDKTQSGFYGNDGVHTANNSFSCSSIFVLDTVPTYYTAFHSVVTWKNGVCNGQTLYANIANIPSFDRIAFNYTVAQNPIGTDVRYGGKYIDPDDIENLIDDVEENTADIGVLETAIDSLPDKIGVIENITYSQASKPLTWIAGQYTSDGSINTVLTDYKHCDYIGVIPGTSVSYKALRAYSGWALIAAFDATKHFLSAKTLFSSDSNFATGTWTVPDGVAYISFGAYKPETTSVAEEKYEATIPTYIYVSQLIQSAAGSWSGKSAVIIGDSITDGLYTPTGESSPDVKADPIFWETAGELLNMSFTGYGISGTSISRTTDTLPSYAMSIRYTEMINADLVIVAGGTNDYGTNVALGTIADQTDISFYGALNVLCDGLQSKYQGKRIVFITPLHRAVESANTAGATLEQYRQAIYDVARDVYGFAVIDGKTMGISCKNTSFKNVYIYDGLHPTQEGHDLYGKCLAHALSAI